MTPPITVQVLGTGSADTSPSILLSIPRQHGLCAYLFNAGEGLQRVCSEQHLKMSSKLKHVLLTGLTSGTVGGLPGLMITLSDTGRTNIPVHGPQGCASVLQAAFRFMARKAHSTALTESPVGDEVVTVVDEQGLVIEALSVRGKAREAGWECVPYSEGGYPATKRRRRNVGNGAQGSDVAISYAVRLPPSKGRFNAELADRLGIKGRMRAALCQGQQVTLPCGRVVQPEEIIGEGEGVQVILVLCAPTVAHAHSLVNSSAWSAWTTGGTVSTCLHLAPSDVLADPVYARSMGHVAGSPVHLVVDRSVSSGGLTFVACARMQWKLHAVLPCAYPLPDRDIHQRELKGGKPPGLSGEAHALGLLDKYVVHPRDKRGFDRSGPARLQRWHNSKGQEQTLIEEDVAAEVLATPGLVASVAALPSRLLLAADQGGAESLHKRLIAAREALSPPQQAVPKDEAAGGSLPVDPAILWGSEVVFLGTGAACPSKYRNVSSTLFRLPRGAAILLDCGEGTLGQLRRRFGMEGAARMLSTVSLFWVSHLHADHHLGLPALLAERARALATPGIPTATRGLETPVVCGPRVLESWLGTCARHLHQPCPYTFAHCSTVETCAAGGSENAIPGLIAAKAVPVEHCADAWALILRAEHNWSIAFSGDTRPCDVLVQALQAEPLLLALIHEATFEDELQAEAMTRRHSTIGEAVSCGERGGAYRVLLTHFSQRYPKIAAPSGASTRAIIAFDLMTVPLALLEHMPAVTKPTQMIFANDADDAVDSAAALPPTGSGSDAEGS